MRKLEPARSRTARHLRTAIGKAIVYSLPGLAALHCATMTIRFTLPQRFFSSQKLALRETAAAAKCSISREFRLKRTCKKSVLGEAPFWWRPDAAENCRLIDLAGHLSRKLPSIVHANGASVKSRDLSPFGRRFATLLPCFQPLHIGPGISRLSTRALNCSTSRFKCN